MEQRPKNPQLSAGIVEALPNEDCLKILQEPQNYIEAKQATAAIPAAATTTTVDETVPLPTAENMTSSAVDNDDDDESSDGEL